MSLADEKKVAALLVRYGFDLGGQSATALVRFWISKYDSAWLSIAIIESLHLGRYKAISVEQVLNGWQRRGHAFPHFSAEFAMMVADSVEPSTDRTAEAAEESLLDAEIALFTESDIAEAHWAVELSHRESMAGSDLSNPALDEGLLEQPVAAPHHLLITAKHQVSLDLTPTNYPPNPPRPPSHAWQQQEALDEVFTPPIQVSQFYYKLRAMAAPIKSVEEPRTAEG